MLTASAPALSYAAIHLLPLLSGHALHVYGLLLLASGMPLTVSALPQGLWWLPGRPGIVRGLKRLIITVCLLAALVGFEGRVVFHSFGQFIKLPPPWDWAAVTFALFGSAGVLLLHLNGTLGKSVDITVAGSLLLLCTTAGGCTLQRRLCIWMVCMYSQQAHASLGLLEKASTMRACCIQCHAGMLQTVKSARSVLETCCLHPALLRPGNWIGSYTRECIYLTAD